jgi:uncharacterized membrane protein
MNTRPLLIANSIMVTVMAGVSAWAWPLISEAARVPIRWGLDGEVDGYGSKFELLLAMPAVGALATALFWFLPRIDPRRANLEASAKFWNAVSIAMVALLAYVHGLLVLNATGRSIEIIDYLFPALALLMVVIGNYTSKTRSNWFGGIRTPWTMSSEYSWERTHRWAGRLFVASGAGAMMIWLLAGASAAMCVLVVSIVASGLVSVILSYLFWKNDPLRVNDGRPNGGEHTPKALSSRNSV